MTIKYQTEKTSKSVPQDFTRFTAEYKLDKSKNKLVVVGKIDCQELVQSNANCALDKILDKFIDFTDDYVSDVIDDIFDATSKMNDSLVQYGDFLEFVEKYRNELKMPDTASAQEIFTQLSNISKNMNAYFENFMKEEVQKNETQKIEQKSK